MLVLPNNFFEILNFFLKLSVRLLYLFELVVFDLDLVVEVMDLVFQTMLGHPHRVQNDVLLLLFLKLPFQFLYPSFEVVISLRSLSGSLPLKTLLILDQLRILLFIILLNFSHPFF